jgi:hypothetical protein
MNARSEHEASYHHTAEFAERVRLNRRVGNVDQREHVAYLTAAGEAFFVSGCRRCVRRGANARKF